MRALPALLGLLLLIGCGGGPPDRRANAEADYLSEAKAAPKMISTALELWKSTATPADWEAAFQATPGDANLSEAYAYQQLLRGTAEKNVEAAAEQAADLKMADAFPQFLVALRAWHFALRERASREEAIERASADVLRALALAQERDPDNAFYYYQEAAFQTHLGETGAALIALGKANDLPRYEHPFGVPFPRRLSSLEELIPGMGVDFWVFFRTMPRTFLAEVYGGLKDLGTTYAKQDQQMGQVLEAGRRQLEVTPFDLPTFEAAVGLNKALWEQYSLGGHQAEAKPVLEAFRPFEDLFDDYSRQRDSLIKRFKDPDEDTKLQFGAASLALTMNAQGELTKPLKKLDEAIRAALPER